MPSRSPLLGPLSLAMGVSAVGLSMLSTAVPLYAVALGATPLWVGAIVALPSLLPALSGVSAGRWVDRTGPPRWLAIGTAGTASAPLLVALLPGMAVLAVAQLALGTFQLFATVAAQSLVAGLGREGAMARDYARFTTSISLGRLIGPALVGVAIDLAGFRPAFALAAAFGALAATVAWRVRAAVERSQPAPTPTTDAREPGPRPALLRNVGVQVAVASSAGLFVALSVRQAFLPVALEAHGYSATAIGTLISVGAAATVVVRPAMPWVSRALGGAARALVVAMGFVAVGVGLLGLATSTAALALLLVAAGVGTGVGLPSSIVMVAGHVGPDRRGAALGLRLSLNRAAQLVAPVLVGAVVGVTGFAAGFGVAGAVVAMSAWAVARRSGAWVRSATMEARIAASPKEEP